MSKNNMFILVVVVLIGSVMWFLKSASDMKRSLTAATLASSTAVSSGAEPTVPAASTESSATDSALPDSVSNAEALASLQARLVTEQQRLEDQRRLLTELQSQQAAAQAPAGAHRQQVALNQAEIRDLGEDLQATRQQEVRVDAATSQSLQAQGATTRQNLAQLDENIRTTENELETTMGLISSWPNSMPTGVSPQVRMQQLQAAQADQQNRLAQLRAQRSELSAAGAQQLQATQGWSAQAKGQLVSTQDAIQTQIITLRDEITRLQGEQSQSRQNVMALGSQVSQVQKDIDAQSQQVQALQSGNAGTGNAVAPTPTASAQ